MTASGIFSAEELKAFLNDLPNLKIRGLVANVTESSKALKYFDVKIRVSNEREAWSLHNSLMTGKLRDKGYSKLFGYNF